MTLNEMILTAEKSGTAEGRTVAEYASDLIKDGADSELVAASMEEIIGWAAAIKSAAIKKT